MTVGHKANGSHKADLTDCIRMEMEGSKTFMQKQLLLGSSKVFVAIPVVSNYVHRRTEL